MIMLYITDLYVLGGSFFIKDIVKKGPFSMKVRGSLIFNGNAYDATAKYFRNGSGKILGVDNEEFESFLVQMYVDELKRKDSDLSTKVRLRTIAKTAMLVVIAAFLASFYHLFCKLVAAGFSFSLKNTTTVLLYALVVAAGVLLYKLYQKTNLL